jgi:hypothetical protein
MSKILDSIRGGIEQLPSEDHDDSDKVLFVKSDPSFEQLVTDVLDPRSSLVLLKR